MKSARCGGRPLLLLLVCLMGFASPAAAQFGVGSISGTVTDGSGGVLPGVTVTLSNPGVIGGDQTTITDVEGAYQFTRLVPGMYTVKGELQGFRAIVQQGIEVNADRTSRMDLKLEVGNVAETVTVSGQAPLLDTTSALQQTVLPRETLDNLPTGYDTWSIARLAPSVRLDKYDVGGREMFGQSNASSHGSTEREYFIDGMDLNQYRRDVLHRQLCVSRGQHPDRQHVGRALDGRCRMDVRDQDRLESVSRHRGVPRHDARVLRGRQHQR